MTATVRVFFHAGVTTAAVAAGTRYTTDSVAMLKQPYLSRSVLTASTGAAVTSAASPNGTKLVFVQVEEGKSVNYEVNPENRTTEADTSSPILTGQTQLECGPGWTLSFIEHAVA